MKRILLTTFAALIPAMILNAQSIKPINASIEEYIMLLNDCGYMAYSYDITDLAENTHNISFEIKEYIDGKLQPETINPWRVFKNRTMVRDFMWRELSKEELADIKKDSFNYKKGIYSIAEKITVCFMPSQTDSTAKCRIYVSNMGSIGIDLK